jgi:hypothetical protein
VTDPTDRFELDAPATRRLTIRRNWGRGLAVLGVATLCAIPAGGALAVGHGRVTQHRATSPVVRPVPHHVVSTVTSAISDTSTSSTTSTTSSAKRPRVDDGRWWPWGTAVSGTLTVVGASGVSTAVTLQRGSITKLTSDTITVLSVDGTSRDWTLDAATRVTGLPPQVRRPVRARTVDPFLTSTTTSISTTDSPSSAAPAAATTTGLVVGQVIGIWGGGSKATSVIVHSTPRVTPTTTVTVTVTSTAAPMAG